MNMKRKYEFDNDGVGNYKIISEKKHEDSFVIGLPFFLIRKKGIQTA